jgi:sulfofructose kinase
MKTDVLCIGHCAYDMSIFLPGFPEDNLKYSTDKLIEACGGPAANAAYLLSLWGLKCSFAGLIGNDIYGKSIKEDFQKVGTDISLLKQKSDYKTALSMILVNSSKGTRTIINRKTQDYFLSLDESKLATFNPAVLFFDGHEPIASQKALDVFPNAISILDAGSVREGILELASRVTYLVASEQFALKTTGLDSINREESRKECISRMKKQFNNTIVVTLGENGLIGYDGDFFHMPAFKVNAIDTTAAGDIFHGAFAYGIFQSLTFRDSLSLASITAAISVTKEGGRTSIPDLLSVKKQFNERY